MSERWGTCKQCKGYGHRDGKECMLCGGTGFDGSSEAYLKIEQEKNDKNLPEYNRYYPRGESHEN